MLYIYSIPLSQGDVETQKIQPDSAFNLERSLGATTGQTRLLEHLRRSLT